MPSGTDQGDRSRDRDDANAVHRVQQVRHRGDRRRGAGRSPVGSALRAFSFASGAHLRGQNSSHARRLRRTGRAEGRTIMNQKRSASAAAPAGPCCFVIFGASGDLTHRLLLPALYNLAAGGLLPEAFSIIGIARGEKSNDAFRSDLAKSLRRFAIRDVDEETVSRLLTGVSYVNGDADDPATYERLARELARTEPPPDTRGHPRV